MPPFTRALWLLACLAILLSTHHVSAKDQTINERYQAIVEEFDAASVNAEKLGEKAQAEGKSEEAAREIWLKNLPDRAVFSHRMVELAATDPTSTAARDALLWAMSHSPSGLGRVSSYFPDFTRAVLIILEHHADDPLVARLALSLDNILTPSHDLLLQGLVVRTKNHEAKGLARLALAKYLITKAILAKRARTHTGMPETITRFKDTEANGKTVERQFPTPVEEQSYDLELRLFDPQAVHDESVRLLEEVARDYTDVTYKPFHHGLLEAAMKKNPPTYRGKPLTPEEQNDIKKLLARKPESLADIARAKLDEIQNLVVGKPAPPIEGIGMDGKPLKLSDYRGKVVMLVFWGTWCGPCMANVPHERSLAKRFKDRPFAILGVDCDSDKEKALKVMTEYKITWPNWNDGDPGTGPIEKKYHVTGYPTVFVIDGQGIIRQTHLVGPALDTPVEDLIKEIEAKK